MTKNSLENGDLKILVLCEDLKSFRDYLKKYLKEINYIPSHTSSAKNYILIKTINCHKIIIEIRKANGTQALCILDEAKLEKDNYDQIFMEFDFDGNKQNAIDKRKAYKEVMEQILPAKIKTIHFYFCFETWLFLHFGEGEGRKFNSSDEIKKEINTKLTKLNIPPYDKSEFKQQTFDFFYNKLNIAIQMAKNINKNNKKEGIGLLDFFDYIYNVEKDLKDKKIEETR